MKIPRKIAILVHESDEAALEKPYIVWRLRDAWRELGIEVEVLHGTGRRTDADLLFPHIDLTVVPPEYARFIDGYENVVNRAVRDVSKTRISSNLLGPDDAWEGAVIVKTDRNFGGLPERVLSGHPSAAPGRRTRLRRLWDRLAQGGRLAPDLGSIEALQPHRYPIFPSLGAVPRAAFENASLVVERFLPEREGPLYCLRNYVFLGDAHVCSRKRATDPVVKASSVVDREPVSVAQTIVEARRQFGFDYGKFDYVVHEGEAILLDANPTPTHAGHGGRGGEPMTAERRERVRDLAAGVLALVRSRAAAG